MKKFLCLALTLTILLSLAACGSQSESAQTTSASASLTSVDESGKADDESPLSSPSEGEVSDVDSDTVKGPLDLTALSSTMVYAEVNNIMTTPENYIGRQITMDGLFYVVNGYDENGEIDPNVMYFACIIQDATACCSQGIEFVLADETAVYPEDYPAEKSEIIVTGEFQAYTEHDYTYHHLINATMSVKQS